MKPKTFLIGYTSIDDDGLKEYLEATGNMAFWDLYADTWGSSVSSGEALCSFYAKLCYAALSLGKNDNVTKTRTITENLKACFDHGHGSVFEHCWLNFVTTDCSRVFTHELVRHRAGTAFSQTSGRYVRTKNIDVVDGDPVLQPVRRLIEDAVWFLERQYTTMVKTLRLDEKPFDLKKKITSALRRILPNGQTNEIGWSVNVRALRHMILMRTSRHAEWEIRQVFNDVYKIVDKKFPLMLYGAEAKEVDGLLEVTGMKMQPYD